MNEFETPKKRTWWRWLKRLLMLPGIALVLAAPIAWFVLRGDTPVDYADAEQHFKYGSTGGERQSGFPYWIWRAMPQVCAEHLPGPGYQSLGMIFEGDKTLPVGTSMRRVMGIDRVFLNCAACHTNTVRETAQSAARLYSAMPANSFDIMAFEKFFFDCAADGKFTKEYVIPEIQRLGANLGLVDRYLIYPLALHIMRDRILQIRERFKFVYTQLPWGPGRVDTFNSAKVLFNFPMHKLPTDELNAPADFPSVWNQGPREGMQLHWDGNNTKVEERNKSAAFGTGTTPPSIDLARIARVEAWLHSLPAPKYPFAIDQALAARGAPLYKQYCADCHGAGGNDFRGPYVGKVTPYADIQTDRRRLDSYSTDLALNQSTLYAGYPWRFQHFRKTFGYANMPLDGIWLRAPYLHNGSVPTLRHLLEPSHLRPSLFYRGNDVYDQQGVGFAWEQPRGNAKTYFPFDTSKPGNGNQGHEGQRYGTQLSAEEKSALAEYLKTF